MTVTAALSVPLRRKLRPRRRKSVSALRIILPAVVGAVTLTILGQAVLRANQARTSTAMVADAPLRMENPRFTGAMRDGRDFLITAASAIRDKDDASKVLLDSPKLTRGYGSDSPTQVVSRQGSYDEAKGSLLLSGDVRIDNGQGATFTTQKAVIDTRTGELMGDAGVQGATASGAQVRADSYTVTEEGDRVIFKGRVRSRITPRP